MNVTRIDTSDAPAPGGWYSQAYRVGDLVYTAGITPADPKTGELIGLGDIRAQTRQTLDNLQKVLQAAGSDLEHVIKTLVFVSDIDMFKEFNEEYKTYFPQNPPARSTMEIGKFNNGMLIEIEAVAVAMK